MMVWGFLLARFDLTPTFCRPAALLPPNTPLLSGGSRAVLSQGRSLSCRAMKALGAGGSERDGRRGAGWRGAAQVLGKCLGSEVPARGQLSPLRAAGSPLVPTATPVLPAPR